MTIIVPDWVVWVFAVWMLLKAIGDGLLIYKGYLEAEHERLRGK